MKSHESPLPIQVPAVTQCSAEEFNEDVQFIEANWKRTPIAGADLPVIDLGTGDPLVFIPILEHLEFVYAPLMRTFSASRRVIAYRRQESRTRFVSLAERVEELLHVLDALQLSCVDFVAHGDAAMVLFEFALRYPQRCRSLVIIAQGADYRIKPHPFIWLLHELYVRLPVEHLLPASSLRRTIVRYITHCEPLNASQNLPPTIRELPRSLIEGQFCKIAQWPAVYRYSVLPVIHYFDVRARVTELRMPILLINRWDDVLSPEKETAWLAQLLPQAVYHVVAGRERFFVYSQAEYVAPLIHDFLEKVKQGELISN
jgi:pimeloyl-ACP methyl ester carboxylesterase